MNVEKLLLCREQRVEGETITQTWERLNSEGKILSIGQITTVATVEEPKPQNMTYDDDLTIPRYKIIQPQCRIDGALEGHYRNMLTDEEFEKLENIVFLVQQNSRTLFPEDDFSGNKRCWSSNGYYPSDQVKEKTAQNPVSPCCASRDKNGKVEYHCPLAEWRNRETKQVDPKGTLPPQCKASIAFLGVDSEFLPFWIVFHGSALPIVKDFLRFVSYKKNALKQKDPVELYYFRLTLSLSLQTTTRGKFYIPRFDSKEVIEDQEERSLLRNCYESLKDRFLSDPLDEE